MLTYTTAALAALPSLCTAQCCSLKVEQGGTRIWLCRVAGGISVEKLQPEGWRTVAGACDDTTPRAV